MRQRHISYFLSKARRKIQEDYWHELTAFTKASVLGLDGRQSLKLVVHLCCLTTTVGTVDTGNCSFRHIRVGYTSIWKLNYNDNYISSNLQLTHSSSMFSEISNEGSQKQTPRAAGDAAKLSGLHTLRLWSVKIFTNFFKRLS